VQKMKVRLLGVLTISGLAFASGANAAATTVKTGTEGWGGATFDFTKTQAVGGTDYFGWDPLEIDGSWSGGTFSFDISMPRALSGGDNFDLVIDWDNDGVDSDGDFIVHYANNGSSAGGGWDGVWDAKSHQSGNWQHIGNNGLADLTQTNVAAGTSDNKNFSIKFDGTEDISYQWLSPMGDEGFPESWTGEAAIIGFWDGSSPEDNVLVEASAGEAADVPTPATLPLMAAGLLSLLAIRRFRA
jgi:hypothetical protein